MSNGIERRTRDSAKESDTVVLLREARERSDARLIEDCREGDVSAFDEIVRRHKDRLYNVIYRFVGNHEDALDVAQEAFVRAYQGLRDFRGGSQVYTWLYSIAANLARNRLRDRGRKGRNQGVSLDGMDCPLPARGDASPRAEAESHEMDEALQQCLNELPDHYRLAFVLRVFDDLSYDEIARVMDCPTGTVKSRINQARTLLRERLTELQLI